MLNTEPRRPLARIVAGLAGLSMVGFGVGSILRRGDMFYTNWFGGLLFGPLAILLGVFIIGCAMFKPSWLAARCTMTTAEAPYPEILRQLGRFPPLPDRGENMPVKLFRLTFTELTFVTWMLIASFVVGIALLVVCHWWWPTGFLKSLADAFVMAGIIGLSLELSAANFLIAKVGDAPLEALRKLPPGKGWNAPSVVIGVTSG